MQVCQSCQTQAQFLSRHCTHCGAPLPDAPPTSQPSIKGRSLALTVLIVCVLGCGFCGAIFKAFQKVSRNIEASLPPSPSPSTDGKENLRRLYASDLKSRLHEGGCGECDVFVTGTTLNVSGYGAPRITASQLLGTAETRRNLAKIGFTTLEASQKSGLGAEWFSYKIETKK